MTAGLPPRRYGALSPIAAVLLVLAACASPLRPSPSVTASTPTPASPSRSVVEAQPFGTVTVEPLIEMEGTGGNVDSVAVWDAPDPADTLLFVTSKDDHLVQVWRFPFRDTELDPLVDPSFEGGDVNGVAVDQRTDRLYVSVSAPASAVAVFELPGLTPAGTLLDGEVDLGPEPNVALLTVDGVTRLYVSSDSEVIVVDPETGTTFGSFRPPRGLETIATDERDQVVYIPDEGDRTGVYAFTPDGEPFERDGESVFGATAFDSDAEGIELYRCTDGGTDDGRGWIVVSDQREDATDFEVFDRRSWAHLGTFRLQGVSFTDGIASTQQAMEGFPQGLFAAVDDDERTVAIGWDVVFEATGSAC